MIVYCNSCIDGLSEERILISALFDGLIYNFQNINFGSSVNEVVFMLVSGEEMFLKNYEIYRKYKPRKKSYSGLFSLDYEKIQVLGTREMLEYSRDSFINEAKYIKDYKLPDFDCDAFLLHLENYFVEALAITLAGKSPSEGKVLNDDIKQAMRQKFMNL